MKMDYGRLLDFLMRGEKNYTARYIKRNRKKRQVFEPNPTLLQIQKFAVSRVISAFPVSKYSMAYEKGCSIQKNAAAHKDGKFAAKYDIENFFGSCRYALFNKLLQKKYNNDDIKILWLIVSLYDGLPVGAYSSPFVSNRLMYDFDIAIGKAFKKITYTRYADDMMFSSAAPLPEYLEGHLSLELSRSGLELNRKKTRVFSEKSPKKITGITIADKKLTVGKRYKLYVKKMLYNITQKGKGNRQKLKGHLNFIKNTEPEYYKKLMKKYSYARKGK